MAGFGFRLRWKILSEDSCRFRPILLLFPWKYRFWLFRWLRFLFGHLVPHILWWLWIRLRGVEQLVAFTEDVGFGWKVCRFWFCVRRGLKSIRVSYVVRSAYRYLLGRVPFHLRGREAALLNGRCWLYHTLVNIFCLFAGFGHGSIGGNGDRGEEVPFGAWSHILHGVLSCT